jgi:hypothetical protein
MSGTRSRKGILQEYGLGSLRNSGILKVGVSILARSIGGLSKSFDVSLKTSELLSNCRMWILCFWAETPVGTKFRADSNQNFQLRRW